MKCVFYKDEGSGVERGRELTIYIYRMHYKYVENPYNEIIDFDNKKINICLDKKYE